MSLSLQKGQNLKLEKADLNLNELQVGLGWNVKNDSSVKDDYDLDVVGLIVNASDGKGATEANFFFYGNVDGKGTSSDVAYASSTDVVATAKSILANAPVVITKDNRTGQGDGDDETLFINSSLLPKDKKILIAVNIYEADKRKQAMGMVDGAYCSIKGSDGKEHIRYDLKEDFSIESGVIVGEIYWNNEDLKVRALGQGFTGDLNALLSQHQ